MVEREAGGVPSRIGVFATRPWRSGTPRFGAFTSGCEASAGRTAQAPGGLHPLKKLV